MSGCGPNCECGGGDTSVKISQLLEETVVAEQPEGWHACLKQKTRCDVRIIDIDQTTGKIIVKTLTAYNSCHVDDAEECPRVTAGSKTGEQYELCGPPNHAEQEVAKLVAQAYPDGVPGDPEAFLYGHTYLCGPCQEALVAVGVRTFTVMGEEA